MNSHAFSDDVVVVVVDTFFCAYLCHQAHTTHTHSARERARACVLFFVIN